jgi:hypothetical protein
MGDDANQSETRTGALTRATVSTGVRVNPWTTLLHFAGGQAVTAQDRAEDSGH